tara:strand:+ start:112 stop:576 length:465 start_codon:yes stop_codon:yes gene_type:complete
MSKYSSYKSQQLITENWRRFINEEKKESLNELFGFGGPDKDLAMKLIEFEIKLSSADSPEKVAALERDYVTLAQAANIKPGSAGAAARGKMKGIKGAPRQDMAMVLHAWETLSRSEDPAAIIHDVQISLEDAVNSLRDLHTAGSGGDYAKPDYS